MKCRSGGMVDTKDLKSFEQKRSCGFDSHLWYIVMIRKRMTEQTLCMKWKLMKHNKSVDKTQTVQTLQPYMPEWRKEHSLWVVNLET